MDDLGWERSMSFQWSSINQQQQLENMFINPVQQLHKTDSSIQEINSNSERVSHQMVHQLAPALDSINNVANSNYNFSRRQEAIRLAADTVLAKSGAGTNWAQALSTVLSCNSNYNNSSVVMKGDPIAEFVNSGAAQASMESLDCLLSATNSNADTSVEDDGISVIFNDCKKLWNNNFGTISGGSSGDSVSKEVEEIISQCSSEKRPNSNSPKRSSSSTIHVDPQYGFSENNPAKPKKPRSEKGPSSSNINFQQPNNSMEDEPDSEAIAQMKEMIYRAAAFMPVNFGVEEGVEKPKRKNVRISSDPQTVAARQRRERISERIRVLQRLVPGGRKMDTASMLDEAANYLKFLRSQVKALETLGQKIDLVSCPNTTPTLPSHQMHMNMNPLSLYSSSSSSLIPFNHHYNSFPMQKTHFPLQNLHPNPPPA